MNDSSTLMDDSSRTCVSSVRRVHYIHRLLDMVYLGSLVSLCAPSPRACTNEHPPTATLSPRTTATAPSALTAPTRAFQLKRRRTLAAPAPQLPTLRIVGPTFGTPHNLERPTFGMPHIWNAPYLEHPVFGTPHIWNAPYLAAFQLKTNPLSHTPDENKFVLSILALVGLLFGVDMRWAFLYQNNISGNITNKMRISKTLEWLHSFK